MIRSMTGFGGATGRVEGVEYTVEIRSVNNRYLKPVLKLPEYWAGIEAEAEDLLRKQIGRGTVTMAAAVIPAIMANGKFQGGMTAPTPSGM